MSGDGTVVWIREFDPNRTNAPPGMGVRFDKLTPESQAVLEQLLAEKAKRDRGGVPGQSAQGAGGIAVRRPSSMFTALDPQGAIAAAAAAAGAAVPRADMKPGESGPAGVPSDRPSPSPTPSGGMSKSDAAQYRPLGTTRNPFAGTPPGTPAAGSPLASAGGPGAGAQTPAPPLGGGPGSAAGASSKPPARPR